MAGLPHDAVKIVARGVTSDGQTWSNNFWADVSLTGGAWGINNMGVVAQDISGLLHTLYDGLKGFWDSVTQYLGCSLYLYPAGAVHSTQVAEYNETTPVSGTTTFYMPRQAAVVASLRTDVSGRSGRGRVYFPLMSMNLSLDGQLDNSTCGGIATAYAAFLTAVNAYTNTAHQVASLGAIVASFTKSQGNTISSVIVDSKVDTQRRREDKVAAAHTRIITV